MSIIISQLPEHEKNWQKIYPLLTQEKLPASLLLVGVEAAKPLLFAHRLIATLLCIDNNHQPCCKCVDCALFITATHPDVITISPEEGQNTIKIEAIRQLQTTIYHTPQRALRRFVIIDKAQFLNTSAVNALLKIIEEPPHAVVFIVVAAQTDSMPATLLSRCQRYVFQNPLDLMQGHADLLRLEFAAEYNEIISQYETIIENISELQAGTITPCMLARQWSNYDFDALLWLLSLVLIRSIRTEYMSQVKFQQLDAIYALKRTRQQQINLNQTLALEVLLGKHYAH